ncbi:extensin [Lucilia sericata]|uniref:extensin n=1 Tax=Lucilia sericata TaxID=13632 RepID=UPI0018A8598E|nr:extensin [Lucilia sericata]
MWLKYYAYGQLIVALLLLHFNVVHTSAANIDQLNNNQQQLRQQHQQTLGQATVTSAQRQQQHSHHVQTQTQNQLQSQQPLPSGIAAHPANGISSSISTNSILHSSNAGHQHTETQAIPSSSSSTSSLAHLPQAQYVVNDKEAVMQEVLKHFHTDDDLNDPYQILNEIKRETHVNTYQGPPPPPPFMSAIPSSPTYPWNLYDRTYATNNLPPPPMTGLFSHIFNPFEAFSTPFPVTPRFMPIMSYPQPVYVPYPFIMSPEMFYPSYSTLPHLANDYEDSMSRGAGSSRRPAATQHPSSYPRNSPIYYVRLPPTPYMFLPSLGLSSTSANMPGYPTMLPYQSLPPFPPFSSIYNVPINFLANGKPTNIYQMSAPPNDVQNPLQFANIPSSFNTRPPPPPPPNAYRPSHNYFNVPSPTTSSNYIPYPGSATSSSSSSSPSSPTASTSSSSHQDSKLTSLKRPYYFNGRPEDIYILPNNFNPLYSSESSYY